VLLELTPPLIILLSQDVSGDHELQCFIHEVKAEGFSSNEQNNKGT